MNLTEKNTQLYEKMAAEQAKYRDWLMGQPPEDILNHAYEYAVREDILAAAELMELPQAQAAALLAVSSPMDAIYEAWKEREPVDLDPLLDCISDRAYTALQAQREPNSPSGTHFMAQVSPDFLARANSKDQSRLASMLPFRSLSISSLEGCKGTYALITKDEDRAQSLRLRKPSVRKKLNETRAAEAKPPAPGKRQEPER